MVFKSGFVAVVGRPNVGKSTLVNALVDFPVSIVSRRPQTTRHRVLGIRTDADAQIVFVDTPGMRAAAGRTLNRIMNRTADASLDDVDLVLLVVTADRWRDEDQAVLDKAGRRDAPVFCVINKIDRLSSPDALLPLIESLSNRHPFAGIVPVSARTGRNLERLVVAIVEMLPEGGHLFPEDQVTDRSERFMAAELIREQLLAGLSAELPYSTAVQIDSFIEKDDEIRISASIWVDKASQKPIIVGAGGAGIKRIGTAARLAMERCFGRKVHLQTWVKVKSGWADSEAALRGLGYADFSERGSTR